MRQNLKFIITGICIVLVMVACSKDEEGSGGENPPPTTTIKLEKKELRGVWMATVWELDWPMGTYDAAAQKKKYTDYLDKFVECKINAVFVQIRPTADSFYNSGYESWSKSITGVAGKDPGYDVLDFMVKEAHARNLEFHAWMNPYRIATRAEGGTFPTLDSKIPQGLVKDYKTIRIYNPALPEVHDRIAAIVKDVITKYDVDGIHFDDYFYPDPSYYTTLDDAADFTKYGSGYTSIEDFRRGNVDKVIKKVYDVIVKEKPGVIFSVSPTSNNEYNHNSLYANVTKWCQEGWIDIVIPQIYSATGTTSSGFNSRLGTWAQYNYKAVPMVGYALYKFGDATAGAQYQSTAEFVEQFRLARAQQKIVGGIMYSAKYFNENKLGIIDILKNGIYARPAVIPFAGRKTLGDPAPVTDVALSNGKITWSKGSNLRTVIYKVENNSGIVVGVVSGTEFTLTEKGDYCLTTVNGDNSESEMSKAVTWK